MVYHNGSNDFLKIAKKYPKVANMHKLFRFERTIKPQNERLVQLNKGSHRLVKGKFRLSGLEDMLTIYVTCRISEKLSRHA